MRLNEVMALGLVPMVMVMTAGRGAPFQALLSLLSLPAGI